MIKIGITGGIGSGKSVVASLLVLSGVPVYSADTESKRLTQTSPVIRKQLTALFGPNLYTDQGLDKKLLASHIFRNAEALLKVNAIIHPEVNQDFSAWAKRQSTPFCAIESAILFESGFDRYVDLSLMVAAPMELRIQRVLERDNATRDEVIARIQSQLPDEIKNRRADYTIYNDDRHALIPQIDSFITHLRQR